LGFLVFFNKTNNNFRIRAFVHLGKNWHANKLRPEQNKFPFTTIGKCNALILEELSSFSCVIL
jgi:hypothetical protein